MSHMPVFAWSIRLLVITSVILGSPDVLVLTRRYFTNGLIVIPWKKTVKKTMARVAVTNILA